MEERYLISHLKIADYLLREIGRRLGHGRAGHPIFLLSSIINSVIILDLYKMCGFHGHTSPTSSLLRVFLGVRRLSHL